MPTLSEIPLSGSTDGRGIKVAASAIGSGTTIHTAVASNTLYDLITLYAYNDDTSDRTLTLGWGGTTDPDDLIIQNIPTQSGLIPITFKALLRNSLVVVAAGSTANVITIHGTVIRAS